ncbi:hypothetical protein MWU75_16670 [Ornithinimicrobium sp. F0845]|uniref:hypothetical protein n=1 Tax=Ornithinimicrobium sp. F0845 TaxID=2926412 RepID=UPI001FF41509|nr:hypothetical protein [Ornithinimicrobium sp. F0845]MCK0113782.1 hypothetical protein [Ornithinimicrobium sp. F0845]
MTTTLDIPHTSTPAPRPLLARGTAVAAAVLLLGGGTVAILAGSEQVGDHTQGLGALSEIVTGLAFLAAAFCLVLQRPVRGWRAWLWSLAPFGLTVGGLTMLAVPVLGQEPPGWLFLLGVVPSFVGLVAAGVLGTRRLWPWWTGVAVALFLPIMFALPFNSVPMAGVWVCVALTARARGVSAAAR